MPFRYSCFISYCHGQHDLVKGFIDQLKRALKAELEGLLDEELYIDEERLKPGYRHNEALATAICQSVCMIVVYSPRYERHAYCLREFTAMELLEARRRGLLEAASLGAAGGGSPLRERSLIIPVILRGERTDLPPRIAQSVHYADFSRFTLATTDMSRSPEYIPEIQRIARTIFDHYRSFEHLGADPCGDCHAFALPAPDQIPAWRERPFPLRAP